MTILKHGDLITNSNYTGLWLIVYDEKTKCYAICLEGNIGTKVDYSMPTAHPRMSGGMHIITNLQDLWDKIRTLKVE